MKESTCLFSISHLRRSGKTTCSHSSLIKTLKERHSIINVISIGQSDFERKEFLYDASSFANTQGGYLIFGMDEEGGVPTKLVGLANVDPDKEILRLEGMLRDGIRPPISGVQTASVALTSGTFALVMRIPKSWNPPHQVTFQKAFRFYARDSNGKYQVDVDELRSIFALSASASESIKLFRIDRVAKIVAGDTPIALEAGAKMVTHILPLAAFTSRNVIDLNRAFHDRFNLDSMLQGSGPLHFNVDGLLLSQSYCNGSRYLQVFRNGCVEIIADFSVHASERQNLPCPAFERSIITQVSHARSSF